MVYGWFMFGLSGFLHPKLYPPVENQPRRLHGNPRTMWVFNGQIIEPSGGFPANH